jgi:hypothetical protein
MPGKKPLQIEPAKGTPPVLQWIPVDGLQVDDRYQRSVTDHTSSALIKRIATAWDWTLAQVLVVARRPDSALMVIDGQHRLAAAKRRTDIPHLPCVVIDTNSIEQEAQTFLKINKERKPVSALAGFHALVAAGNPAAVDIKAIVMDCGFRIGNHTNISNAPDMTLVCVAALTRGYATYGEQVLRMTLSTFAEAYPDQQHHFAATLLRSLFPIFSDIKDGTCSIDPDVFLDVLASKADDEWYEQIRRDAGDLGLPRYKAGEAVFKRAIDAAVRKAAA